MRHVDPGEPATYAIHEVYLDTAGAVIRWTEEPAEPLGDSRAALLATLEQMAAATALPVLDGETGQECEK